MIKKTESVMSLPQLNQRKSLAFNFEGEQTNPKSIIRDNRPSLAQRRITSFQDVVAS